MTPSRERRRDLVALAAAGLLALPFALSTLVLPWGRDQGIYAHAAARLLDGHLPYAGTFVFKPPATVVVHAAAMSLFGREMLAIRAFDLLWTLATVAVLFALARRATGSRIFAALAGVAFAVLYHQHNFWNHAQTDGWTGLPIALALLLALGEGRRRAVLAGVCAGLAVWFKYSLGLVLPLAVALPLLRRGLADAAAVAGGFTFALAGGVAVMVVLGVWPAFVEIQTAVVAPYVEATGGGASFWGGVGRLGGPVVLALAAAGALAVLVDLGRRRVLDSRALVGLAAIGWAGAALVSAWVQGKFFAYHYLPAVGAVALLIVLGLASAARLGPRARAVVLAVCAVLLGVAATRRPFPERWTTLGELVRGRTTLLREYARGSYVVPDMSVADNLRIGTWLREHVPADEPIFVWSYDPMIYVLAGRDMVSRFPYTYPLVIGWGPVDAYRAELMTALRATPPAAFVVGKDDAVPAVTGHRRDSRRTLREFSALHAWLREHYAPQGEVGRFQIWTRRAGE